MAEGDGSPRLSVHAWSAQLQERTICFQALRLEGQVMIWVGEDPVLGCLAMAVPLVDCPSTQVRSAHRCAFLLKTRSNELSAQVIGNNDQSLQLSSRLAKKLSKQVKDTFALSQIHSLLQVLVSFNLEDDVLFTPMVIGRLMQEIKDKPDKF